MERIPDDLGTAVNVQMMVFGNMGETSGTGVAFTRNPITGAKELYGDYLANAQGEDVVAGVRDTEPISALKRHMPKVYAQFERYARQLEKHYKDVQDLEFTIERGKLYMLQTRSAKRTGEAAVNIAVDMVKERLITKKEAVARVEPRQLEQLLFPRVDPAAHGAPLARGFPESPGAACGRVPPPAGVGERRLPARRCEGARERRPGCRTVPHGAHVHGAEQAADRAGHDHGHHDGGAREAPRQAAAHPARRLRRDLQGDGGTARDHPAHRPSFA